MKKQLGRLRIFKRRKRMTGALEYEDWEILRAIAQEQQRSVSELVRAIILGFLADYVLKHSAPQNTV